MTISNDNLTTASKSTNAFKKRSFKSKQASRRIDLQPTNLRVNTFLRIDRLYSDYMASRRILYDNIKLITRIMKIQHNSGSINAASRNTERALNTNRQLANLRRAILIGLDNRNLGNRILNARSTIKRSNVKINNIDSLRLPVPLRLIDEFSSLVNLSQEAHIYKIFRPSIFIDLKTKNIQYLGRLTIELYTEACPELVLQIVRVCSSKEYKNWSFTRIFENLWIECELRADGINLSEPGFPYTPDCIDNNWSCGILSFSQEFVNGFPEGLLNFTISLRPLIVMRERRVPFGRVINGLETLRRIKDFGTKRGKMRNIIKIINSGILE